MKSKPKLKKASSDPGPCDSVSISGSVSPSLPTQISTVILPVAVKYVGGLPTSIEGLCPGSLLAPITSGLPKLPLVAAHGQVNTPPMKFLPVDGSVSDVSIEGLFVEVGCPASIPCDSFCFVSLFAGA